MSEGLKKKRAKKLLGKKTLTTFNVFDFKTQKRIRIDQEAAENGQEQQQQALYEPLWKQVKDNFKLRDDT